MESFSKNWLLVLGEFMIFKKHSFKNKQEVKREGICQFNLYVIERMNLVNTELGLKWWL